MRQAVSIHLVENEHAENSNGGRIVPQLLSPETDEEPEFDYAVAEQIEGGEVLAAHRQTLRGMEQIIGNEVVRILRQFHLCEGVHQVEQELPGNEEGENAGGDFHQRKCTFEQKADLKGDVNVLLAKQFLYVSHFQ